MTDESAKPARRNRAQIAKDEAATQQIADIVKTVNRFDPKALREAMDQIGDVLVEAGRL